jgi:hypothetical protein
LGDVNKLLKTKILPTTTSNVLPLHLKQTFLLIIQILNEGDGIKSRLPFKIFSTLSKIMCPIFKDHNRHYPNQKADEFKWYLHRGKKEHF